MSLPTCPTCKHATHQCGKTGVRISRTTGCTFHEPKPLSNGDRIRAMTDEELAYYMMRTTTCPCEARASGCCRSDITCQKAWLDRLREKGE